MPTTHHHPLLPPIPYTLLTPRSRAAVEVEAGWVEANLTRTTIPQLRGKLTVDGEPHDGEVTVHRQAVTQFQEALAEVEREGLGASSTRPV